MKDLVDYINEGLFDLFDTQDAKTFISNLQNSLDILACVLYGKDSKEYTKLKVDFCDTEGKGILTWRGTGNIVIGKSASASDKYTSFLEEVGFIPGSTISTKNGKVRLADGNKWKKLAQDVEGMKNKRNAQNKAAAIKDAKAAEWSEFCAHHLEIPNKDNDGYAYVKKEVGKGNPMYSVEAKYNGKPCKFWFGHENTANDAQKLMLANGCKEISKPRETKA